MRRILAAVSAALCAASLASAQTTTTTVVPSTTTTVAASTSTTTSSSTSTSSTITLGGYDPRTCADESSTKEECRRDCCSADFEDLAATCNGDACGTDWDLFVEQWQQAGDFFKYCQNTEDDESDFGFEFEIEAIGQKYREFNVDDTCQEYRFGCKKAARKHARQCADSDRCVGCCRTTMKRWRARAAAEVQRGSLGPECRKAVQCLRRVSRQANACRNACRRRPACGAQQIRECLAATPKGRTILDCYAKCSEKCSNRDSYKWCYQACQGLDQCDAIVGCGGASSATTTSTTSPPTSTIASTSSTLVGASTTTTTIAGASTTTTVAAASARARGECLERESLALCVEITTTSTSTSSTTSTTSQSTTSTSSSTTTTSPF